MCVHTCDNMCVFRREVYYYKEEERDNMMSGSKEDVILYGNSAIVDCG